MTWRFWQPAKLPEPPAFDGGVLHRAPEETIADGVTYAQPVIVPADVRAQGNAGVIAFLRENFAYYRGQFDKPYRTAADLPVVMPTDDPLCEWDHQTRKQVLTTCHAAYQRNPIAKRAIDLTSHFAVGKGHTLTCKNTQVKDILDAFRANPENNIFGYERSWLKDLGVDGELFIQFFTKDGETVIAPTPPWWVEDVETDPDFFRRITSWLVRPVGLGVAAEPISVPAENMLHVAINNHSYELRGRPDLFVILPWLKAYKDWLEDRYRQNKWRGALLWLVQIAGSSVNLLAQKAAQYAKPPTSGSVAVVSDKETWSVLNNPVAANDASEDGRQFRMMCASGMGLAEYMLGDGENANLASATAQQLPALWKFTDAQELMREQVWTAIYKRVIREAVNANLLPAEVVVEDADGEPVLKPPKPDERPQPPMMPPAADGNGDAPAEPPALPEPPKGEKQTISAEAAFEVTYHDLQSDDPKTLAEALSLDLTNNLVSKETASGKRGYDYTIEKKKMDREQVEGRDKVGMGLGVDPALLMKLGQNGMGQPPGMERDGRPAA